MANITFTVTTTPSTTCPSIPANLQLNVTASIPYGIIVSTLGTNPTARRQVQNRLNQRARRERQATEKSKNVHVFDLSSPPLHIHGQLGSNPQGQLILPGPVPQAPALPDLALQNPIRQGPDPQGPADLSLPARLPDIHNAPPAQPGPSFVPLPEHHIPGIRALAPDVSWCKPLESFITENQIADIQEPEAVPSNQGDSTVTSFEKSFLNSLHPADLHRLPGDDHLLSLMYYNVFRGLASNSKLLGLDTYAMHSDDYPSPFITGSAYDYPIPPHLQPTLLQQTVAHHPCFDIFPDPVVRDRGIANTHLLPHSKLCMTLAGRNTWFENDRSRRSGLVIWGPPEDANSWEVTEGFLESWRWLITGSFVLQYSTNRWRAARGEPPMTFA